VTQGLDLTRYGAAIRFDRNHVRDAADLATSLVLLGERQRPTGFTHATRGAAVASFALTARAFDEDVRYVMQLTGLGEVGGTADGRYGRQRSSLTFGTARGFRSLVTTRLSYGTVGIGNGSVREQFAVGGFRSPLVDPMFDARRVEAPAYPVGSAAGATFATYRVGVPVEPVELFYSGATVDFFQNQLRSYGAELRERVPAIAALGTPDVDLVTGFARALDEPVRGRWRYYVSLAIRP
jgi:hypothetical protein